MEHDGIEARLAIMETKIASLESRQAIMESHIGTVTKRKPRRELTPEEKATVRARLVAGQENARLKREAEAKATGKLKKEVTNGAPKTTDEG